MATLTVICCREMSAFLFGSALCISMVKTNEEFRFFPFCYKTNVRYTFDLHLLHPNEKIMTS